jgi:hypothetical protein
VNRSDNWHISESRAHLKLGPFEATLDITLPNRGLHELRFRDSPLPLANLLAVWFTAQHAEQHHVVSDCFIRGRDLVVTYAQQPACPVRLQVYWRAVDRDDAPDCLAAIDVQVSVQTSLLDAWPALTIGSQVPTRDVAWMSHSKGDSSQTCATTPTVPAGYWRCRLVEHPLSYGEMVHPVGAGRDELIESETDLTRLSHHLFAESLEKGVILRAQARGVLTSTVDDDEAIAAAYGKFLAAPLPLTT